MIALSPFLDSIDVEFSRVPVKNAYLFKSPDGRFADSISYLEYDGAFVFLINSKFRVQQSVKVLGF